MTEGAAGITFPHRRLERWLWALALPGTALLAPWCSRSGLLAQATLEHVLARIHGLSPWGPALVVSTMPFRTYALATGLGLIPGVTAYVLAGYSVRRARDLEAGLAAAGGALLGAYLVAAWWRQRASRLRRRG